MERSIRAPQKAKTQEMEFEFCGAWTPQTGWCILAFGGGLVQLWKENEPKMTFFEVVENGLKAIFPSLRNSIYLLH
jgi:hypothetical protein